MPHLIGVVDIAVLGLSACFAVPPQYDVSFVFADGRVTEDCLDVLAIARACRQYGVKVPSIAKAEDPGKVQVVHVAVDNVVNLICANGTVPLGHLKDREIVALLRTHKQVMPDRFERENALLDWAIERKVKIENASRLQAIQVHGDGIVYAIGSGTSGVSICLGRLSVACIAELVSKVNW